MATVSIEIHLKKGVTDPEGSATAKALKLLGFDGVTAVRYVKRYELEVVETDPVKARATAEAMCRKLLANPVIHDYVIQTT